MSMSSYLIARARGFDMIALPVFPSRRLFHTELSYHTDSGIKEPGDLVGKRLGVGEYQQTAALWTRGILEHEFGVSQFKVHWYMERTEELSHGGATGFTPPPGISFQRIPSDKSMASMLVNNELDAAAISSPWKNMPNVIGRSHRIKGSDGDWSKVKPLFPDRISEGARLFQKWGFLPVNHAYIIRGDIYKKYPWVAFNLYSGFVKAKQYFNERLLERIPTALFFGPEYLATTRQMFGRRPVSVWGQSQSQDAGNTDRLFPRTRTDFEEIKNRRAVRAQHAGPITNSASLVAPTRTTNEACTSLDILSVNAITYSRGLGRKAKVSVSGCRDNHKSIQPIAPF